MDKETNQKEVEQKETNLKSKNKPSKLLWTTFIVLLFLTLFLSALFFSVFTLSPLSLSSLSLSLSSLSLSNFSFSDSSLSHLSLSTLPKPLLSSCDLQKKPCPFEIPNLGKGLLDVNPRPLRSATKFQIQLTELTFQPDEIEMDLQGVDMKMGYNRPRLKKPPWSVQTLLPFCTKKQMEWKLTLYISVQKSIHSLEWRFQIEN